MARLMQNPSYSELTTISTSVSTARIAPSNTGVKKTEEESKPQLSTGGHQEKGNYFGEFGKYGEFKGGLMDEDSGYDESKRTMIITSKEDVLKYRKHRKSVCRFDDGKNHACQQCMIQ